MATSGSSPINPAGNQQALIKRADHMGQTAVTGQTRKADGSTVEQDHVTLGQHEENAGHIGLTGQQASKQARQGEAKLLDPEELGKQLFEQVGNAGPEFQEAFKQAGKDLTAGGAPSGIAAGQAAINASTGMLQQLGEDITLNPPSSLQKNPEFAASLKANFEADRAAGRQSSPMDILRQTVEGEMAKNPGDAELKGYHDKMVRFGKLEQINQTGRDFLHSMGATPAGEQMITVDGQGRQSGQGLVPTGAQGVVPAGSQGVVPTGGGIQVMGPDGPRVMNAAGLLEPAAGGAGGGSQLPPTGNGPTQQPGQPGQQPPGSSAFQQQPPGSVPPGGVPPGGVPPGGMPPGGSAMPPGGPGGPGGPTMSAADQARRMQQILQDQESARDIWMQIWAERQKHEAERWKIMKETMDYWMKTFQESTVNQAMTMQRVNEMWHQYFRS